MKTETWSRDSHGLFDYESATTIKSDLSTTKAAYITRKNDTISLEQNPSLPNTTLAKISLSLSSFTVSSVSEPLWQVVRPIKDLSTPKGYILKPKDILKFGRVKFFIRELKSTPTEEEEVIHEVEVDTEGNSCKICLSEIVENGNPLISPCKCAGTMKFIHVQCLQMCVSSLMSVKSNSFCKSYSWKSMHCTLCGEQFPYSIRALGTNHKILAIERPEAPYFIMEGTSQHGNTKGMHSVSLRHSESVMLGRGHESDIRIGDISVSRCHAKIIYFQGNFILEDNHSKFGTLVQINNAELEPENMLSLQSGRSLLQFTLKSLIE